VIPANQIDPRMANALSQYLRTEITQSLNDRAPLEERWNRYLTAYRAMPLQETKRFPFEGAANLTLPADGDSLCFGESLELSAAE
jgi:hypothetical protein